MRNNTVKIVIMALIVVAVLGTLFFIVDLGPAVGASCAIWTAAMVYCLYIGIKEGRVEELGRASALVVPIFIFLLSRYLPSDDIVWVQVRYGLGFALGAAMVILGQILRPRVS